jgi:hypothetical protein
LDAVSSIAIKKLQVFRVFVPFLSGIIISDSLLFICSTELQHKWMVAEKN